MHIIEPSQVRHRWIFNFKTSLTHNVINLFCIFIFSSPGKISDLDSVFSQFQEQQLRFVISVNQSLLGWLFLLKNLIKNSFLTAYLKKFYLFHASSLSSNYTVFPLLEMSVFSDRSLPLFSVLGQLPLSRPVVPAPLVLLTLSVMALY